MATPVSRKRKLDVEDDELLILLSEQRRELTAAITADSDLDFAFQLQMQEAIKVSLTSQPSSSSSSSHQPFLLLNEVTDAPSGIAHLVAEEIDNFERERSDRAVVEAEARNVQENLNRLIHDQIFARQIKGVPDDEWRKAGDNFEKPYGLSPSSIDEAFRVYFKGLVSDETVMNAKMPFAGIGVAICDTNDCCVFELRKPYLLGGNEGEGDLVELKALIEALNTAVTLGLRRVHIFCDSNSSYQYLTGKGRPTNNSSLTLIDDLNVIQRKFAYCIPFIVEQDNVKFAFQFARDAINSQATKSSVNISGKTLLEQCTICFEYTYIAQIFSVNKCQHRYCFSCMRKHVEAKLHQGKLPECPHEGCKSELEIETCKGFLNPELYDIMSSQVKEASIPPSEKVYCPISSCSALMSKTELQKHVSSSSRASGKRKCVKCHRRFCMNCNVAWHDDMTCGEFIESFEYKAANEAKLKSLASTKKWRQCVKCKNMVELATGCNHISCRCGHEFCYTCGGEWINKKATCTCPKRRNINHLFETLFLEPITHSMDVDDTELLILLSEQRRELSAAMTADSDLDFAFQLQMQEAIKVSSASQPSSSSSSSHEPFLLLNEVTDSPAGIAHFIAEEIDNFELHRNDREFAEAEARNLNENLNRLIHDQVFARQIHNIPEDEWINTGDYFEKPYGLSSSSNEEVFRVYFKGLVSYETVVNVRMPFAGIGVAICDTRDYCVFELRKPFLLGGNEGDGDLVELKAMIEAMNAAVTLGIKRVHIFCHSNSVYQHLTGKGHHHTDNNIVALADQLNIIQTKFAHCSPFQVAPTNVKFAFQLARDAIASQVTKSVENFTGKALLEQCTICFEYTYLPQMFTVNKCQHRYCFSCMSKHVEAKLHQGILPQCPHEGCKSDLEIDTCKIFLDPKLYDIMNSQIKEASIPPSEKVYCPVSSCSALMSRSELHEHAATLSTAAREGPMRKCVKCHRLFCVDCNVPWHYNVTCCNYKQPANEVKLKSLATRERWRQCIKCKNMVELAAGCYHIYCRCGYEFCYTCGAEWINKKATCRCPIWDENNIIYQ
ncbi:hypothetical protein LXL04_005197 [Taraxacum kok-saghyz]